MPLKSSQLLYSDSVHHDQQRKTAYSCPFLHQYCAILKILLLMQCVGNFQYSNH